jgi:hypothetical protein
MTEEKNIFSCLPIDILIYEIIDKNIKYYIRLLAAVDKFFNKFIKENFNKRITIDVEKSICKILNDYSKKIPDKKIFSNIGYQYVCLYGRLYNLRRPINPGRLLHFKCFAALSTLEENELHIATSIDKVILSLPDDGGGGVELTMIYLNNEFLIPETCSEKHDEEVLKLVLKNFKEQFSNSDSMIISLIMNMAAYKGNFTIINYILNKYKFIYFKAEFFDYMMSSNHSESIKKYLFH